MIALTLTACATAPAPPQQAPAGKSDSPATSETLTITHDQLEQTGRSDLADALRATSPIFH